MCYFHLTFLFMYEYKIQILVYLTVSVMFSNIYTYVHHFIFISSKIFLI